jgi:hypothetical protein
MKRAIIIVASLLLSLPASALPSQCYRNEGCCLDGVQFRADFFPMCSAARKTGCIQPGKAFLKARAECKKSRSSGRPDGGRP